jgi:hypothetical protein
MTRQTWQYVIGACLCVGLIPGCAHSLFSLFDKRKAAEELPTPPKNSQVTQVNSSVAAQNDRRPDSPFHPNPPLLILRNPDSSITKSVLPIPDGPRIPDPLRSDEEHQEPPQGKGPPTWQVKPASLPQAGPSPPEEPLVLALARLLKDDPKALDLLDHYDPPTRELFQRLLPVLASLSRKSMAQLSPEEAGHMLRQLQPVQLKIRARAELVIDRIYYSQPYPDPHVRFKRLPDDHPFLPQSDNRPGECVCIYVELRNLGTVFNGDCYETRLASSVEIRANGVRKFSGDFHDRPLRSPDVSGDFFNTYSFYMPANIPPGRYELVLKVRDETTKPPRVAEKTLPFIVAADALAGN